MGKAAAVTAKTKNESMRGKVKSDFPKNTLIDSLVVPQAIMDKNSGDPLPTIDLAEALGKSPGNSEYRIILSSSGKYGLTTGNYSSEKIALEDLAREIVQPSADESKKKALITAALLPATFRSLYEYYKKNRDSLICPFLNATRLRQKIARFGLSLLPLVLAYSDKPNL